MRTNASRIPITAINTMSGGRTAQRSCRDFISASGFQGLIDGPDDLGEGEFAAKLGGAFLWQLDGNVAHDSAGPAAEDDGAIGQEGRFHRRMRDEHDGHSMRKPKLAKLLVKFFASDFIESGERLVEQKQGGFGYQGTGEGDAHFHSAGELVGIATLEFAEADLLEGVGCGGEAIRFCNAHQLQRQGDISQDTPPGKQVGILKNIGDVVPISRSLHGPAGGAIESGDDSQQRGFSATRRAEDCGEFTSGDLQGDFGEGFDFAVEYTSNFVHLH